MRAGFPTLCQRPWRRIAVLGVGVFGLLFVGSVAGLYFQGPGTRAFFGLTGLEPGGARQPVATSVTPGAAVPSLPTVLPRPDEVVAG